MTERDPAITLFDGMVVSKRMQIIAVAVAGVLLAGVLSPLAAGVLVCLDGDAPDCCDNLLGDCAVLAGSACGCCVTVEALPLDLRTAAQKALGGILAPSLLAAVAPVVPPSRLARDLAGPSLGVRPAPRSTVVLLI